MTAHVRFRRVFLVASCFVAAAACVGNGGEAARPSEPSRADHPELFIPQNAEYVLVSFERETLPNWRVRRAGVESTTTREIRIIMGHPIALNILSDRECRFMIPAMRVDKPLPADRYQIAWFTAVEAGTYEVIVQFGTEKSTGKLIVEGPKS